MKQKKFFVILVSAILAIPLLACLLLAQARLEVKPEVISRVDEKLAQLNRDGVFSGSALVAQDGVVLLSKGYGLADRVQGIPNTPQTRFHLGSMAKQFTALGILMLESQGKLNVQDPICSYLSICPAAYQGITLHHLLTNTSGLSPWQSDKLYRKIERGADKPATPAEQADYLGLTAEWPVGSQPGEEFVYNNFGYILLTHVIEQASGQSYADFLQQNIFTPLNLQDTGYQAGSSGVAKIYPDSAGTDEVLFGTPPISDGSDFLYSSAEDLFLWVQALNTHQLPPQGALERMFEPYAPKSDFPPFGYGYGSLPAKILGRPIQMASGGGGLFVTIYFHFPADGLTLIVLTNQGAPDFVGMILSILAAITGALFLSDLVFAFSAIAFMLLLAVLLAAQKERRLKATWVTGVLWLLLAAPLALVFSRYLAEGRGVWTLLPLSLVLLFMLAKAALDFVFKVGFGQNQVIHLAYLALESLALFSLVWIEFSIHPSWGIPVLIAFGVLAASVIFIYWDELKIRQQPTFGNAYLKGK